MTTHEQVKSNWELFCFGQITLAEMIELNKAIIPVREPGPPPEVVKAEKMFGATRPFGHEKSCPKEEDRWNY